MNIVCRDVQKVFYIVWTQGLKCKIINIPDLPIIIQKILCCYISNRTAQIRIENFKGDKINFRKWCTTGRNIITTFIHCMMYTRHTPLPAGENNTEVIFADDITQIIQNLQGDSKALAEATTLEIESITTRKSGKYKPV